MRVFIARLIATLSLGSGDWVSPVASGRRGADRVWSCCPCGPAYRDRRGGLASVEGV